ncbi:MAG: GGDEF domain-containing protein [Acholeplasmataceae bacterium]|jgi:diguanylate cyclase (GGDEF)-like protein|nr:GGDEF domain-containing protein [Acholeplasmataceae bacterium]
MSNKLNPKVTQKLKESFDIDLVDDVLLGQKNRVLFYADVSNPKSIELCHIHGDLTMLGFKQNDVIELNDLFNHIDLDNKYAEVSGKKEYKQYVNDFLFLFQKSTDITFPVIISGSRVWLRFISTPIKNNIVAFHVTDASFILNQEEKLYEKTHRDSLTGLFNKYTLDFHYGKRYLWKNFHVLYLDLDNFKIVNDTYGHRTGNEYLIMFSNVLKKYTSEYNHFYRIGGDEFVGLFFETEAFMMDLAKKLLTETREIRLKNTSMKVTVSIGIVKATQSDDLIRKADDLLYRVKASGKNNYMYENEI